MILSLILTQLYGKKGKESFISTNVQKDIFAYLVLEKFGNLLKLNILNILVKSPGPVSIVAKACQG